MRLDNAFFLKLLPIIIFILGALVYFYPVLQGKAILQSDIVQYQGMAKERDDFRKTDKEESYWTNSAFGGMPTFQLGAHYPHHYIKSLDRIIRFLPRPADYLFLYFLGMYVLLLALRLDVKIALLGALAYGFSTYLIIILGVGHNAKAHALGYFPVVMAGLVFLFSRRFALGFFLFTLGFALELVANHFQMTYYLFLFSALYVATTCYAYFRDKKYSLLVRPMFLTIMGLVLGLALNATNLLATYQYSKWSTRSANDISINPDGSTIENKSTGLDYDYITEFSYGFIETFNLIIPRIMGGASREDLGRDSATYRFLINRGLGAGQANSVVKQMPTYWGDQMIVEAPAFIGFVVCFLAVLALFLCKRKNTIWIVLAILLSLILSWGKHIEPITRFLIDHLPFYNKFRAVSSAQVILECAFPILAALGIQQLCDKNISKDLKQRVLKLTVIIFTGILFLLFVVQGWFGFEGINDQIYTQYFGQELMDAIKEDRKALYNSDLIRSLMFLVAIGFLIWFFLLRNLKTSWFLVFVGVLILMDLLSINKNYVNASHFERKSELSSPFKASETDKTIMSDTTYYRVFDSGKGFLGSQTSYFHKALGGYHAAKPKQMQNIIDFYLNTEEPKASIFNLLNVKYIIHEKGVLHQNEYALGNAWFVKSIVPIDDSRDKEIMALDTLNFRETALLSSEGGGVSELPLSYETDVSSSIRLVSYKPNALKYITQNANDGFAVFSEVYYPKGWKVFLDGKPYHKPYRSNYFLRGIEIPKGQHTLLMRFDPEVIGTGSIIQLLGAIFFVVIILVFLFQSARKRYG